MDFPRENIARVWEKAIVSSLCVEKSCPVSISYKGEIIVRRELNYEFLFNLGNFFELPG